MESMYVFMVSRRVLLLEQDRYPAQTTGSQRELRSLGSWGGPGADLDSVMIRPFSSVKN